MVHAYVMVATESGGSPDVLATVRKFDRVTEAHIVAGEWDLVVEVDADRVYEILSLVSSEIGTVAGVDATRTYIVLE
ncbi:transcriptional regulator, AsnC family [Halogranum amylolyticum]|uniref:Transcriptional regulator, AsnC family n=1 Tax=Halogranum amylolyticum TaxID=660520 RepID=A0A1H8W9I6_9EURY|nr:Lrp/AsnC ligand binding domain-containing protein [Halogranum amylolyticum]SEP24057.1 transcriptional regulator, AsnC family [Halogranum amylolyticum]